MLGKIAFVVCVFCVAAACAQPTLAQTQFLQFMNLYKKSYDGPAEILSRFSTFEKNLEIINRHNEGNHTWTMGINQFSDLTNQAFVKLVLTEMGTLAPLTEDNTAAPHVDIDWRKQGAVSPVQNQGASGASSAFASAGALEGYGKIHTGTLTNIEAGPLAQKVGPNAFPAAYFRYVLEHPGTVPVKITGQKAGKTEAELLQGLTAVPTTVLVDASNWQSYRSGVFNGPCGTNINHCVLVVAANDEAWGVKNSWGTGWGESGYIRIARGKNLCAIGGSAVWPL